MTSSPILNAVYPSPPEDDVRAAFRKHVAKTGQPEIFPTISTTRPPVEGTVEVLVHPVDINRKTRPRKDEAPCPICSADAPKWLHKGSLIWCEATQAIYAIGPDCYSTLWRDGRMNRAINLFMESERAKADGIKLYHLVLRIPRLQGWITANRSLAVLVEAAHTSFSKDMGRLRAVLSRSLKATNGMANDHGPLADIPIGVVGGRPFLSGRWSLIADLDAASETLSSFPSLEGEELLAWIDALTPSARAARCKDIERMREALAKVEDRISAARDFLSDRNVQILGRWSRGEGAPASFTVVATASRITFRSGEANWQGPALLPAPIGSVEPIRGWSLQDAA